MASFPFDRYTNSLLTVERPTEALQATLRANKYEYACDHGLYGDQLWVHGGTATRALLNRAQRHAQRCPGARPMLWRCEPIANPGWRCSHDVAGVARSVAHRVRTGLGDAAAAMLGQS